MEPVVKRRSPVRPKAVAEIGMPAVLRTGDHCPSSGWWAPKTEPGAAQFISEGSVVPAYQGAAVAWVPVADAAARGVAEAGGAGGSALVVA